MYIQNVGALMFFKLLWCSIVGHIPLLPPRLLKNESGTSGASLLTVIWDDEQRRMNYCERCKLVFGVD